MNRYASRNTLLCHQKTFRGHMQFILCLIPKVCAQQPPLLIAELVAPNGSLPCRNLAELTLPYLPPSRKLGTWGARTHTHTHNTKQGLITPFCATASNISPFDQWMLARQMIPRSKRRLIWGVVVGQGHGHFCHWTGPYFCTPGTVMSGALHWRCASENPS